MFKEALAAISIASHIFVNQLEAIGTIFHWPPHLVALFLSPVATELPETMNAVIWVRQGKERLALANISGAMMIQATVPSALGIIFTPGTLTDRCWYRVSSLHLRSLFSGCFSVAAQ
jgi:cation:H+ antiporter